MQSPFATPTVISLGPVPITEPVLVTWAILLLLALPLALAHRRLRTDEPAGWQSTLEILVTALEEQISSAMQREAGPYLPLLATLFVYILIANLSSLLPGVPPPTGYIETPMALALIVFAATHIFGTRERGLRRYLGDYLRPNPFLLPLNIVSEITRTFALMVRLFGNIMSSHFVIGIIVSLAGLFLPVPFMLLDVLTGVIQAYIFTILAAVFLGGALGAGSQSSQGESR